MVKNKSNSELWFKEGVKDCPLEITGKRNYLKGKVGELWGKKKKKAISGGGNSDRISLETAGEQKPST